MRVLIAGAHGAVGRAAATELGKRHTIVTLGRSKGDLTADLMKPETVSAMLAKAGRFDAIVSCTGHTYFGPLATMTPAQFMSGINDKLMGQVNLVLEGLKHIADGGSFTLTS
ncbi:MAG: sugar nucleotide-binding protein, partial [Rhizobiales bacterium]|nr:sugar nucleotide-binding protein [Hyphomicrobiales bacterium]